MVNVYGLNDNPNFDIEKNKLCVYNTNIQLWEVIEMVVFDRDTIISEVLEEAPGAVPVFMSIGMHCLGCAMSSGETIEEACAVHGVDPDEFLEVLNAYVAQL